MPGLELPFDRAGVIQMSGEPEQLCTRPQSNLNQTISVTISVDFRDFYTIGIDARVTSVPSPNRQRIFGLSRKLKRNPGFGYDNSSRIWRWSGFVDVALFCFVSSFFVRTSVGDSNEDFMFIFWCFVRQALDTVFSKCLELLTRSWCTAYRLNRTGL